MAISPGKGINKGKEPFGHPAKFPELPGFQRTFLSPLEVPSGKTEGLGSQENIIIRRLPIFPTLPFSWGAPLIKGTNRGSEVGQNARVPLYPAVATKFLGSENAPNFAGVKRPIRHRVSQMVPHPAGVRFFILLVPIL